mgnify:CR=1 FL=1|jgi:hypothetical protein
MALVTLTLGKSDGSAKSQKFPPPPGKLYRTGALVVPGGLFVISAVRRNRETPPQLSR